MSTSAHALAPYVRFRATDCALCNGALDNDDCLDCEGLGIAVGQTYAQTTAGDMLGSALLPGEVANSLRRLVRSAAKHQDGVIDEDTRAELLVLARFAERDWDLAQRAKEASDLHKVALEAEQRMREEDRAALELATEHHDAELTALHEHLATLEAELETERQRTEHVTAATRRTA